MRPAALLLLGSLFILLPATDARGEDWKGVVRDLGSKDWKVRGPAYRTLVKQRNPEALPHLRRALPEFDVTGQYYGVVVLDQYPRDQITRTWRKLIDSEVPWLRFAAATGLLRHGDDRNVDVAAKAFRDEALTPTIRIWMLQRGGRTPHPEILAAFRKVLNPGVDDATFRTLIAILHRNQDRGALPRAELMLDDPRADVRAVSAAFLYSLGRIHFAPVLARALRSGVSIHHFGLIKTLLPANRRVADPILDAIAAHLKDEKNIPLLIQQIDYLRMHRHQKARHALKPFILHPNEKVAEKAFDVLVGLSGSIQEDALRPLLTGDNVGRRLWAAEALRRRGDTTGVGVVLETLRTGSADQRRDAAAMLASFTMDLAVEPLIAALADENAHVREAAYAGLAKLLARLYPYRRFSLGATAYGPNADPAVRRAAIDLIHAWWQANKSADW